MANIKQITINGTTYQIKDGIARTAVINHGTSDTTFELTPNILHIWGEVTSLTLTLATPASNDIENEYRFRFASPSVATTLTLPQSVVGVPTIKANTIYEFSISDNLAIVGSWEVGV